MNSVVFFGTDEFAAHILSVMLDAGINVKAVVTKPDRAKTRNKLLPSPVKEFLQNQGVDLPLHQPAKASTKEFAEVLRGYEPDLFVVVSYGEIINQELLDIPRLLPINIHPSALPKYRGASPLRSALLNGDKEIGIAIIEMVKAMDAGDILAYETLKVCEDDNHSSLQAKVFEESGKLLLSLLERFEKGSVEKRQQGEDVTFTKKFTKEDLLIDWNKSCDEVLNQIKAFGDEPGAFCYADIGGKKEIIKIIKAKKVSDEGSDEMKITHFSKNEGWSISMKGGSLQILLVQKQGKKIIKAIDFINGLRAEPPRLLQNS